MDVNVFQHSVKLPTQYKNTIKILKKVIKGKELCKDLLRNEKHTRIRNATSLLNKIFKNKDLMDKVIEKSLILKECPRFDYFTCLVLVTELLIGSKNLNGKSKPVLTVLDFKSKLEECFNEELKHNSVKEQVIIPRYVRVNTLKITLNDAKEICENYGFRLIDTKFASYSDYLDGISKLIQDEYLIDYHEETLFVFHHKNSRFWAKDETVLNNKFILQDKASCFPAMFLNLEINKNVLDLCAAPGNKTIQIAAALKNKGKIYAIEKNEERYKILCKTVKDNGAKCVKTIFGDALLITHEDVPDVDCILVDPSCSGSGIVKRIGEDYVDAGRLVKLSCFQKGILSHAMRNFPNVKRIVYSTCSTNEEENEAVIQDCLHKFKNFELINPRSILKNSWINFGNETKYGDVGKHSFYTHPETDLCNGFFVAVLEKKKDNEEINENIKIAKRKKKESESTEEGIFKITEKKHKKIKKQH